MIRSLPARFLLPAVLVSLLTGGPAVAAPPDELSYARHIQPLLKRYCLECHGPETQESGLRVDRRSALLQGGDSGEPSLLLKTPAESYLLHRVSSQDPDERMPPTGPRMQAAEIKLLQQWIAAGASFGSESEPAQERLQSDHWSLQPLRGQRPSLRDPWIRSPLDAFILDRLRKSGLTPSPEASRPILIRRLYLDLLGLLPEPDAVEQFVQDTRPDAYERLVDRLLASPRYGERWARHWLDVARFAETNGFETNTPRPNAYHYRDYVIRALNQDLPYDQFVFEQLAGDAVGVDAATGFLVGGAYDQVKSPDVVLTLMQRQDELADMVNTTGMAFLGMTVGCARCHNHKFDPILQKDFYALQAVFAGVQHGERPLRTPEDAGRAEQLKQRQVERARLQRQLQAVAGEPPLASPGLRVLDEQSAAAEPLATIAGRGTNPPGTQRGQANDLGTFDVAPNISGGQYTWWKAEAGQDLMAYRLGAGGSYRIWISWGAGHRTHATDATYWLDVDGDLSGREDQIELARVDQRHFADGTGDLPGQALWSGLLDVGAHRLDANSRLLLRGGSKPAAVTADVIVLQPAVAEAAEKTQVAKDAPTLPRLVPAVSSRQNEDRFPPRLAKWIRFRILKTNGGEPCLDELEVFAADDADDASQRGQNVALASKGAQVSSSGNFPNNPRHKLEHLNDGQYGNDRSWISNERGAGWVEIELAQPVRIDRVVWGRDRKEQFADRTATDYRIEVAVQKDQWEVVSSSDRRLPFGVSPESIPAYQFGWLPADKRAVAAELWEQLEDIGRQIDQLTSKTIPVYAGQLTAPPTTHRLYRGDPLQPREAVAPDTLTVLGSLSLAMDAADRSRREALARWISGPGKPLSARVVTNRLWQHHFGNGLVTTPNDLGKNGSPPSHPELLDWLAAELVHQQWSWKRMQRILVLSATYRQSSTPRPEALVRDAGSRLLWRYPPRRLEAEAIRDTVLQLSGGLDLRMYGPGYDAFEPNTNYVRVYRPRTSWSRSEWRRMIYMTKVRMEQDGVFGTFDCPDGGQPAPRRSRSTTALQALSLLNSNFILQQAKLWAERIEHVAGPDREEQMRVAFQMAYGREPAQREMEAGKQLAESHGLNAVCRAILNSNEFLFLP